MGTTNTKESPICRDCRPNSGFSFRPFGGHLSFGSFKAITTLHSPDDAGPVLHQLVIVPGAPRAWCLPTSALLPQQTAPGSGYSSSWAAVGETHGTVIHHAGSRSPEHRLERRRTTLPRAGVLVVGRLVFFLQIAVPRIGEVAEPQGEALGAPSARPVRNNQHQSHRTGPGPGESWRCCS